MKLEQKDNGLLFSNTELPDVFFTEYLSMANGDCIKIYLYLVFLAKYGKDVKLNDLSKKLNLPLPIIQASLTFWEEHSVITKKGTGYILNNLQEIELHKLYKPNLTLSEEKVENNSKSQYRAKAIESINNRCFQGIMSPSWYSDIDLWFKKYEFDEGVMISLFDYALSKSALHKNYVQTVAEAWANSNIKTCTDLENYYQKYEKMTKIKKHIAKKLGRYNPLTQYEEAYIEKWVVEFGYDVDIINIALKRTTSKANPSFDYIDKLLSDWHDRKLRTPTDVENFLVEFKQKNKNVKEMQKSTTKKSFNTFEQREYEDLDKLYGNMQTKKA
ncbi:MAG: DnaD domain protein [Oscillospiraceae bacterium]|nr:DnaD domain protein [Oscillospiraceae bacterium]